MIQCLIPVMMKLSWWFVIYSKLTLLKVVHARIKVMHCQKQVDEKGCGVFSVAFATAIVLGLNTGKSNNP